MKKELFALLVYDETDPLQALQAALRRQSIDTCRVSTCKEAQTFISGEKRPDVIFTDTTLPDGTWADLLQITHRRYGSPEVVVVSRLPEAKLYMDVMERGAFDFITPPFAAADVAHVIQSATTDASKRWSIHGHAAGTAA